ncbi:MAG: cbb3-type cytochrome oxidase assembly protein CcoS [Rhodospirillales bacterium]
MSVLGYLIPAALFLGLLGLCAFLWAMKSGQFEDLDGAAMRILIDDDDEPGPEQAPQDARPDAPDDAPENHPVRKHPR